MSSISFSLRPTRIEGSCPAYLVMRPKRLTDSDDTLGGGGDAAGYVATSIIFVDLARCLVEERSSLPVRGGVFTPGAVFHESGLIERLQRDGIDFVVLEESDSPEGQGGRV